MKLILIGAAVFGGLLALARGVGELLYRSGKHYPAVDESCGEE